MGDSKERMTQGAFNLNLRGRYGNLCFQVAFALAYCKRHDLELRIEGDTILEKIFDLKFGRFGDRFPERQRNESTLDPSGEGDVEFTGYCQNQQSLIYTRTEAKEWFRLRYDIKSALGYGATLNFRVVAHHRNGDYTGAGFPVVSIEAIKKCFNEFDLPPSVIKGKSGTGEYAFGVVSEEFPRVNHLLPSDISFLQDWYALLVAPILIRANSSFSFWAATLGEHERVFSPVIDGLEGGREYGDTKWVEGNYPRLANHSFTTDLHLQE